MKLTYRHFLQLATGYDRVAYDFRFRPIAAVRQAQKNPALGGACRFLLLFVQTFLRLRLAAIPSRPMPRSASVPGSGTL